MVFATRAQASVPGSEVSSQMAVEMQSAQRMASTVAPEAGPPAEDGATSADAALAAQASSGGTVAPAVTSSQRALPGPPAPSVKDGATAFVQQAASGAPESQGAPPVVASAPAIASPPAPPPSAASGAVSTGQAPASTAASVEASAATMMLERQRHAAAITGAWPAASTRQQPQPAAGLAIELRSVISQFESLAHDTPNGIAVPAAPEIDRARTEQLALVSVILSPSPLPEATAEPRSALNGAGLLASSTIAPPQRPSLGLSRGHSDRLAAARRASRDTPAEPAALPSGVGPSLAGAALGGGATGLAAPAAALLVVAAACLLATRSRARLRMDPLPWKSALLSLRLERPG